MAINYDVAFKFGCGRYIQAEHAIAENLYNEIKRLGNKVLFICGENGGRVGRDSIIKAIDKTDVEYEIKNFHSTACMENADEFAEYARNNGFDIICGVGGGVLADTSKLVAEKANTALIQIPTSSATCASATPLSVMFDRNTHHYLGSYMCGKEADAVIVDTEIMINQPARLFWAGVMDSKAKMIEMTHYVNYAGGEVPIGLDIAYGMAKKIYEFYSEKSNELKEALETKKITKTFELAVFYAIAVTGIISGLSKGAKQSALAHHFYENVRTLFYNETAEILHGELVAMGLIIQLAYNKRDYNSMILMLQEMKMPVCFSEINVAITEENINILAEKLCVTTAVNDLSEKSKQKMINAILPICN